MAFRKCVLECGEQTDVFSKTVGANYASQRSGLTSTNHWRASSYSHAYEPFFTLLDLLESGTTLFKAQSVENSLPNDTEFLLDICIQLFYAWIPSTKRNPGIRLILHFLAVTPA